MAPTQPEPSPLPNPGQTFVVPGNYSSTKGQSGEGQKPQGQGQQQGKDGKSQRLIVVSNRLPVTISKDKNGEYHFKVCLLLAFYITCCRGWLAKEESCSFEKAFLGYCC